MSHNLFYSSLFRRSSRAFRAMTGPGIAVCGKERRAKAAPAPEAITTFARLTGANTIRNPDGRALRVFMPAGYALRFGQTEWEVDHGSTRRIKE